MASLQTLGFAWETGNLKAEVESPRFSTPGSDSPVTFNFLIWKAGTKTVLPPRVTGTAGPGCDTSQAFRWVGPKDQGHSSGERRSHCQAQPFHRTCWRAHAS